MRAARKWHGAAAIASALAILAGVAVLAPGASVAAATHSCGSHTIKIDRPAENGAPPIKVKLTVSDITTKGVSCQAADSFLNKLYTSTGGGEPEKYKCAIGDFKVPRGKVPEVCTRSGKKIQFAGAGG